MNSQLLLVNADCVKNVLWKKMNNLCILEEDGWFWASGILRRKQNHSQIDKPVQKKC